MGIGIEVTTFTSEGASESVNATMNGRARRRFKIQLTRSGEATYSYVGVVIAFLVPSDQPNIKNIQYRIRYNGQEELLEHIPDSPGTSRVVRLSDTGTALEDFNLYGDVTLYLDLTTGINYDGSINEFNPNNEPYRTPQGTINIKYSVEYSTEAVITTPEPDIISSVITVTD